jgi:hypothetical protein
MVIARLTVLLYFCPHFVRVALANSGLTCGCLISAMVFRSKWNTLVHEKCRNSAWDGFICSIHGHEMTQTPFYNYVDNEFGPI